MLGATKVLQNVIKYEQISYILRRVSVTEQYLFRWLLILSTSALFHFQNLKTSIRAYYATAQNIKLAALLCLEADNFSNSTGQSLEGQKNI
jgi:hypothetical protein